MKNKEGIVMLVRTAVFLALLVTVQLSTAPLDSTLVTGSLVNLIIIISVMTNGFASGMMVAVISPVFAKLFGTVPLWSIVPCVMAGNAALVLVWYAINSEARSKPILTSIFSAVFGAVLMTLLLFFTISILMVPLLKLPDAQAEAISSAYTMPQFVTALIGGGLAVVLLPALEWAILKWEKNKKQDGHK